MLSKTQSKYIRSLAIQKFREEHGCFIAEGEKIVREWLSSESKIHIVAGVSNWLAAHQDLCKRHPEAQVIEVSEEELKQISNLQTPNKVLVVARTPEAVPLPKSGPCLVLDGIRDPGNMGTLLRIADWYGIPDLVCSPDCVDAYNPKVVQSAMGAQLRVRIHYTALESFLATNPKLVKAAMLGGEDYRKSVVSADCMLVIGNESSGIRQETLPEGAEKVMIPRRGGAESLNAAVSAGILCAHFFGS